MSSNYSTNLAIELIGTGEQAGNWGSTTNNNLGTLIEQAIAGYATYSCSGGTDTLTMTSGASATARNMYIQLNGTGGGTVVVPGTYPSANTKLYFIFNNTASAITVKVSGQTGVSVPAAAKIVLACNGSDIISAINYIPSATFPSPTLTGTPVAPTASAGTNTTQIATTAFVTAALAAAYPIGAIYTSTVSTSPATLLGFGTWSRFGQGRVLLSADDSTYIAGATGGSADATVVSHTHSATSTSSVTDPGHSHQMGAKDSTADEGGATAYEFIKPYPNILNPSSSTVTTGITVATSTTVSSTGSSGTGANLQPYIVVYMWNRTA